MRERAGRSSAVGAHLVPEGSKVDVYVTERGGAQYWGTYTGTGEGVIRS